MTIGMQRPHTRPDRALPMQGIIRGGGISRDSAGSEEDRRRLKAEGR